MYTVRMLCHIVLPYLWEECEDSLSCTHIVHTDDDVEKLNAYPLEWAKEIFNFTLETVEGKQALSRFDSNGEAHNDDGPAIEHADGSVAWWLDGVECSEADVVARRLEES